MHNLTKIKLFRAVLWLTFPLAFVIFYPIFLCFRARREHIFFFFDRFSIGGAQRVHLDILDSVSDIPKQVYFTRKSPNDKLKAEFQNKLNSKCSDIHFWCDNLIFRIFSVHYFAMLVNHSPRCKVLGANSTFYYDMLPFLSRSIQKIELLHNFSYGPKGMEFFGLANCAYLNLRLVIDKATLQNIFQQYKEHEVAEEFSHRVRVIEFGVNIPASFTKPEPPPLTVIYAGRGTPQKRIWLVNSVAEHFIHAQKGNISFVFAGSMSNELTSAVKDAYVVHQEIGDRNTINRLLEQSHILILLSSFEGFPLTIKEAMAYGCIPLVTALPGNLTHLLHMQNAVLVNNMQDEAGIVKDAVDYINTLNRDEQLLQRLSLAAYEYARKHFSKETFMTEYRKILC